ncbi:hypothetical protein [Glycomyces niveus]|uniref:DUF2975 domain-containing protein n=1 Tax=Glycomyces niveus TaxID=2820287 RepID=A0ABS3UA21_9ACTN|nr:hypothetical protein [Glycomyces sp. NEAU-S30]MBO3735627.1 hypothetical protein [Glycomyces sp. NEAU-S30]
MTVPPPHPNPYLPPGHPYGPPRPPRMPGLTTTAVVLLWVMVAISTFSALLTLPMVVSESPMLDMLPPDAALLMSIGAVQGVAWAGLRACIAVKIVQRSSTARSAAFIAEGVGMACQLVLAVLLFNTVMPAAPPEGMSVRYNFDCTGLVLPILVICFLSTARSRWWCDR